MAGFKAILGHEQIIEHLQNAVTMDKVSHAYIINGPDKSGKMMLAEAFAQTLECEKLEDVVKNAAQPSDVEPCMECHSCKQAMTKNQPDIIYVRHEKPNTISVDDIRTQVNNDIVIKPYSSRYKIYMIDEAEKMNEQAQNALLKTIEAVGTDDPRRSAARRYGLPHSPRRHRAPKNGQKTYFSENTSQFFTKYSTPE